MGKKFRVLLAESDPGEAADSLRTLYPEPDSHLELSVVSSIPTLLGTIDLAAPETIFLDLSLGHPDPLEAVRRVHRAAPGIPLIVLADVADKSYATRCISEGAIDYLLKGFMDTRAVERALRTALELNTLEGLADLLRDQLTGLYSRDGFTTLGNRSDGDGNALRRHARSSLRSDREFFRIARRVWLERQRAGDTRNGRADRQLLPA